MGSTRSVPNAPLSHGDEEEHRRLIATRANAIGYEEGVFTPEFTFVTPGDLSNAYATQQGSFWRVGPLVHFTLQVKVTPTFTTASGAATITGLPYAAAINAPDIFAFPIRLVGTGVVWPANRTSVVAFMRNAEQTIQVAFQKSADGGANMVAANVTSATSITFYVTGFYAINTVQ